MRVVLERSGGVAGVRRTLRLGPPSLDGEAQRRLRAAAERAGFFGLPSRLPPGAQRPDAFHYRLEVDDGRRSHAIAFSEADAPEALLALVEEIEAAAR